MGEVRKAAEEGNQTALMEAGASYSWLSLQQLLDSALPIGSFAHSYGLETLVQEGAVRTGTDLQCYLCAMLRQSWSTSDAMVIKAVYESKRTGDADYGHFIERMVHLQRLGVETREGIEKTGRRLLKMAPALWPGMLLEELQIAVKSGRSIGTYPLVYGALCIKLGVPLNRAAEGYLYSCVQASVNAALRLMSMGQQEAQRIVSATLPAIAEAWEAVREMDPEDAYGAMPLAEMAMVGHERLYSRLFMS